VVGPDEYRVDGGSPYPTEGSGIETRLQMLRSGNPQCEISRIGMIGGYGEPYVRVQAGGRAGAVLNFSMVGNDSQPIDMCAAWPPPSPPAVSKKWLTC
jgi:hypothetical protein